MSELRIEKILVAIVQRIKEQGVQTVMSCPILIFEKPRIGELIAFDAWLGLEIQMAQLIVDRAKGEPDGIDEQNARDKLARKIEVLTEMRRVFRGQTITEAAADRDLKADA